MSAGVLCVRGCQCDLWVVHGRVRLSREFYFRLNTAIVEAEKRAGKAALLKEIRAFTTRGLGAETENPLGKASIFSR